MRTSDEGSFHLLENSFATTLLFVYTLLFVHSAHIVVCAFAYLSIPFSFILVVVVLLGTCSMYLCRVLYCFYLRNNVINLE